MNENGLRKIFEKIITGKASREDLNNLVDELPHETITSLAMGDRSVSFHAEKSNVNVETGDKIFLTPEATKILIKYLNQKDQQLIELPPKGILVEPGLLPSGSRVPFMRNIVFTGRDTELLELADTLLYKPQDNEGASKNVPQIAGLTGLGGVGKSQLAIEFCYRYGHFFEGVHWLQADQDFRIEVAVCGESMGIEPWPMALSDQFRVTIQELNLSRRRLVVLDNFKDTDKAQELLSMLGHVRVLITTNQIDWLSDLGVRELRLDSLIREESLEMLRKLAPRLKNERQDDLDRLALRLGDLPLALDLAGRFLYQLSRLSVDSYLKEIDSVVYAIEHDSLTGWTTYSPTKHNTSLVATFSVSYEQLRSEDSEDKKIADEIFCICSYCAPNVVIPYEVIEKATGKESSNKDHLVDKGLHILENIGLIKLEEKGALIHPLLAEFGKISIKKEEGKNKAILSKLLKALIELGFKYLEDRSPKRFEPLRPHLEINLNIAEKEDLEQPDSLWIILGLYFKEIADYQNAFEAYNHALIIERTKFGENHPSVLRTLNNIGRIHEELGEYSKALTIYNEVYKNIRKSGELEEEFSAKILNNIGVVLHSQGKLNSSKQKFEQAIRVAKKNKEANPRMVALGSSNLGGVLMDLKDINGAFKAYQESLEIIKKYFGIIDSDAAITLYNLGGLYLRIGDLAKAMSLTRRALLIENKIYGSEHPNIAIRLDTIGEILLLTGKYQEGIEYMEKALIMFNKFFPSTHPRIQSLEEKLNKAKSLASSN